jgi:methionine-rich copper-binding protein CopC
MSCFRFNAIAILAFWSALSGATGARAHARLDHASPAVGSTVGASPSEVVLSFTENVEAKFSGAEIRNSAGARVDQGSQINGNTIHVGIKNLPAGAYSVNWHVLSVDTHKTQGSFSFHVGK